MKIQEVNINDVEVIENIRVKIGEHALVDLMNSIKQHGLLQPIGLSTTKSGKFVLEYGHRRLVACKKLGWTKIPALVGAERELKDHLIINITENLQRKDNSPLELGRVCHKLMHQHGMTKNEIASRLSCSAFMVQAALDCYSNVPNDMREKIVFMPKGGAKNGSIPASSMSRIINIARKHKLSKPMVSQIMETARTKELSNEDMKVLASLLSDGHTPNNAMKTLDKLKSSQVQVLLDKDEIARLEKKHNLRIGTIIEKAIFGEIPHLTRPVLK